MTRLAPAPAPVRVRAAPVRRAVVGSARNSQRIGWSPCPTAGFRRKAAKGDEPTDEEGLVMACGRRAA
jgi:hypothetical protein